MFWKYLFEGFKTTSLILQICRFWFDPIWFYKSKVILVFSFHKNKKQKEEKKCAPAFLGRSPASRSLFLSLSARAQRAAARLITLSLLSLTKRSHLSSRWSGRAQAGLLAEAQPRRRLVDCLDVRAFHPTQLRPLNTLPSMSTQPPPPNTNPNARTRRRQLTIPPPPRRNSGEQSLRLGRSPNTNACIFEFSTPPRTTGYAPPPLSPSLANSSEISDQSPVELQQTSCVLVRFNYLANRC